MNKPENTKSFLMNPSDKILSLDELQKKIARWKFKDLKIVFTNGCFDLVHKGHIDYLFKAKQLGDVLIVGLNSDKSVKKLNKGENRPIQDENSRAIILSSLYFVNALVLFDEDTPLDLIKLIQPNVLVKGSDYKVEEIAGHEVVLSRGGEVKLIDYLPGFSTSGIEKKIKEGF